MIDPRRTRVLNSCSDKPGAVIYWMSRDQRLNHNWALLFAREKAARKGQPLVVVFALAPSFLDAPFRHYDFMLKGLEETSKALERINIPFMLLEGEPDTEISRYACQSEAGAVVTDFSPLNISRNWKKKAADILDIPLYEVDAHNIVPCWYASDKQEYAARTLRPKLQARLDEFLVPFPTILPLPAPHVHHRSPDWKQVRERLQKDRSVPPVNRIAPGETAAAESLENFIKSRLSGYATARNDPNSNALSQLSPYLHFGQISAQHVALRVAESRAPQKDKTAFLEELIIRRELSDNFCNYNPSYDRFEGIPAWAKQTLLLHGQDKREYLYTIDVFEKLQRTTSSGTLPNQSWFKAEKSTVICGCTGRKKFSNGVRLLPRHLRWRSISTTDMRLMEGILTVMLGWHGRLEACMTAHGSNVRSMATSDT